MGDELDRARKHLLDCQFRLLVARRGCAVESHKIGDAEIMQLRESNVLAALSWVSDAQDRVAADRAS